MAEARGREAWNHTSALLATIININRPKGKSAVKAETLNPYRSKKGNGVEVISREEAIEVFRQIAAMGKK
jgi:hypothetical protein